MENIILILLWIIIILLIVIFLKVSRKEDNSSLLEKIKFSSKSNSLELLKELIREFSNLKWILWEKLDEKFWNILKENRENERILKENLKVFLEDMSDKVDKKLEKGFEKTNETFSKIIERLAKIDEAQKNIDKLNTEVVSLQNVLTNSKSRWIFWEIHLQSILENIFWEKNDKMFEMQYHFKKQNVLADCVIKTAKWLICVDSKFPLNNYQKLNDKNLSPEKRKDYEKMFVLSLKRQIDDISKKYIIPNETVDQAFMFIPAEAIFAEINAYHNNIIEYAHSKNIYLASPTTLMAMLTIILAINKNIETRKEALVIQEELWKLWIEFSRFENRWNKFTKDFKTVWKDIDDIDYTNKKIISKFCSIDKLELSEKS